MVILHGSGATVTEISGPALTKDEWQRVRHSACRLLVARGNARAARALERLPFELLNGTNYFEDEFLVLYAVLPLEQYVKVEEIKASGIFHAMAETITELGHFARFVAVELESAEGPSPVPPPSPKVTSEAIETALSDAEHLIRAKSPASAIDRVHTALHGYVRALLDRAGIEHDRRAPTTRLFKLLREHHPVLRDLGARADDLSRIVLGMASVIDALTALRNNASVAHPNETLLDEAEAMLAINSGRTLFHYLDSKIEP